MVLRIPLWRTGDLPPQCPPRQRPRSSRTSRPWVSWIFLQTWDSSKIIWENVCLLVLNFIWIKMYGKACDYMGQHAQCMFIVLKLHFYSILFNPKMYFLDSSSYLFVLILWLKKIWSHLHSIHCIFIVFSMESHKNKAKPNFHGISFSNDFQ